MIEKVARAICRENVTYNGPKDGRFADERVDEEWQDHVPDARAALTAMLEPTEVMVLAAVFCDNRTSNGDTLSSDQIREEFRDAIQAALDE